MTFPQVIEQFEYWKSSPPVHELVAMLARCFTTWKPAESESGEVAHRRSLEERWKNGAMNIKQIFEASGGNPISIG